MRILVPKNQYQKNLTLALKNARDGKRSAKICMQLEKKFCVFTTYFSKGFIKLLLVVRVYPLGSKKLLNSYI